MKYIILASANHRASVSLVRALHKLGVDYGVLIAEGRFSKLTGFPVYQAIARRKICGTYNARNSEAFITSLVSVREKGAEISLFPTGETLLRWALEKKRYLHDRGIYLPVVDLDVYQRISDKESFVDLMFGYGFDVPENMDVVPDRFEFPFVVKPRAAAVSVQNVLKVPFLVETENNFDSFLQLGLDLSQHFFQRYVKGPSFYYCASYDAGKKMMGFSQQTIYQEPNGGSVFVAVPAVLPDDLVTRVDRMMRDLEWMGVMMMEFKKEEDKYYAIECNPRFWGPLQLALDNGVNFAESIVQLQEGRVAFSNGSAGVVVYGYVWLAGFLNAGLKKIILKKNIQHYLPVRQSTKIKYRDVWLRRDTIVYFFVEWPLIIISALKGWIRSSRRHA